MSPAAQTIRGRAALLGAVALVTSGAMDFSACGGSELERLLPTRPGSNVLVISFDALRADHLGTYGYELDISPSIDDFAAQSVVFDEARVGGQATPTSFAAAFTGRYPHEVFRGWELVGEPTLAEWFGARGYRTGALLNNVQLDERRHFGRGFDDYSVFGGDDEERLTDLAIEWLRENRDETFFLWVHYISPHSPYRWRDVASHLYDPSYEGPFERTSRPRHTPEAPADRQRYRELYDGEILAVDRRFQRLIEEVESSGLFADTVVVVTADHGEELAERGLFGHKTVYEEVWRVPLIVHHPAGSVGRIDARYANVDLFPTLAGIVGLEVPPGLDGMDVRRPERQALPSYGLAMTNRIHRSAAILSGDDKLLVRCSGEPSDRLRLFDLSADPRETDDLAGRRGERVHELMERMKTDLGAPPCAAIRAAARGVDPTEALDAATTRELGALGYVDR